jgi:serine/threonine protein kinase
MGANFRTGKPVAAVECRSWGMLTKSFYIAEEIPSGSTVVSHWREKLRDLGGAEGFRHRRVFLAALAGLFRSLHEVGIYHNDLKEANIFVCRDEDIQEGSFHLLDLEGIRRFRHLGERRRVKNLVQLNRTMGRMLSNTKKIYFLKTYLGRIFSDGSLKREWIRRIIKVSEREDKRSLRKASG